nr:zinc finger protein ZAT1-like [Ipomoea batatas]GME18656.1 zinc finger protein ZAT1-like [Ipomoea batatas]
MEKFKCKLCFKQFVNGKALGGHMRSHLAVLPLPPKTPPQKQQDSMDGGESTLSLCSSIVRSVDPDPEFVDRESESESTRNPTRRRSKRARRVFFGEAEEEEEKGKAKVAESSSSSSFSDDEEIARCLMTLSQDVWSKTGDKFQCQICCRHFKSSQALGSHRTTHNRGEIEQQKPRNLPGVQIQDQKIMHECPFCGKLFGSGQALGGHKRSHSPTTKTPASSSCSSKLIIDLNLPAPMEDDDEPEEAEVSAVSDEFRRVDK